MRADDSAASKREPADAELSAAVADYDDVLVSLVAEVVADYVQLRVLDAQRFAPSIAAEQPGT